MPVTELSRPQAASDRATVVRADAERIALALLLVIVALIPLPFGSARPWAWSLFTALAAIALGVWLVHLRRSGGRPIRLAERLLPPMAAFALVLLWAVVQILPWTPRAWHPPLWAETAAFVGAPYRGAISFDAQSTVDAAMRLLGYGAMFLLAWGFSLNRDHAARIVKTLLWTAVVYAAYGLVVQFSGSQTVLWFHKWAYFDNVTGPFVNRNTFATYLGFATVLCSVMLFGRLKPALEPELSRSEVLGRLAKGLFGTSWSYLASGAVLLTALVLTGSRAGIASTFLGLLVVGALLVAREASRRSVPLLLVVAGGLAAIAVLSLSGEDVVDRTLAISATTEERQIAFALTLTAIADHVWAGIGLGTFDPVFAMYRNATLQHSWDKAHNVYLETVLELGLPAAALLFCALAWIVVACGRGCFIRRRDRNYPLIALGCAVIAGVHSTLDFSLQIPAVAATFAVVLGVGFAQSFSTERTPRA
jgi:O-antigen ligase